MPVNFTFSVYVYSRMSILFAQQCLLPGKESKHICVIHFWILTTFTNAFSIQVCDQNWSVWFCRFCNFYVPFTNMLLLQVHIHGSPWREKQEILSGQNVVFAAKTQYFLKIRITPLILFIWWSLDKGAISVWGDCRDNYRLQCFWYSCKCMSQPCAHTHTHHTQKQAHFSTCCLRTTLSLYLYFHKKYTHVIQTVATG